MLYRRDELVVVLAFVIVIAIILLSAWAHVEKKDECEARDGSYEISHYTTGAMITDGKTVITQTPVYHCVLPQDEP